MIIAAAIMSSCGLYTKYERADMHFVDSLYRRMSVPSDSVSTASVSWDRIFTDSLLQEWIRLGLQYNTDLNVARLRVEEAEASLLSARGALLPGLSASASGGVYPGSFSIGVNASWEADIFGTHRNAKRKAQAAVEQSEAYRQAVQTQLVATIANNYYTLLMLDEQLKISKRTLDTWEENIRTLEALKRAGKTNEAAVLQAKANRLHKVITKVNNHLKQIGEELNLPISLTTYVARHSQATVMKKAGVPTALISQIMGHSSERVTQIYLDSFGNDQMDEAMKNLL